jgi:UDP-N-acetylmuramoylalanine--D-glutamate ligase
VVLLSPGGTSFDEFRDFEERGECFKQLVMQL